jgi:PAS domain S-box-containing protein
MSGSPEAPTPRREVDPRGVDPPQGSTGDQPGTIPPHEGAELLRLALRAVGAGAWSFDLATFAVEFGPGHNELIGLDPDAAPKSPEDWLRSIYPDDRDRVRDVFQGAIATAGECQVEYRLEHPGRGLRWLMTAGKVMPSAQGGPGKLVGISLDITERKQAEQERRDVEKRDRDRALEIEALMDAVPAAVWIARDPSCQTITGNRAAAELLRAPPNANMSLTAPESERLKHFYLERNGVRLQPHELPLQVAVKTGKEIRGFEEDLVFGDGTVRRLFGNASPLFDEAGKVRGGVAAFVDVAELKAALEALRETDRRKDEFLATLAHELRNPVAAIDSVIEINKRSGTPFAPDADWAREVLERQVKQLARLIDDLLDVSRISRGKIHLRLERFDAAALIASAAGAIRPMIEQYRHQLTIEPVVEPLTLDADPTRLEQVLVNLLTNACKYTDPGGTISIKACREGEQVVIAVSDNGLGLTPESHARLFELFTQFNTSPGRARGGLGIGLKLVQALTERHGGTVTAESAGPGRGSTFTVRLPVASGPAPKPPAYARSERTLSRILTPDPDRPEGYILVVDDNVDAARGLSRLLRAYDFEVKVVHDGPSALAAATTRAPATILLDIGLPGMDGYEVARRLRGDLNLTSAQIIAVSGYAQDHDRASSSAAGIDHHVVKPVDLDRLLTLIRKPPDDPRPDH